MLFNAWLKKFSKYRDKSISHTYPREGVFDSGLIHMIINADHFEKISRGFGATEDNMRAAASYIDLATQQRFDLVDLEVVATTTGTEFRPWIRIKAKKSGLRVIVEQYRDGNDTVILIHAVIPRDAHTYEEVEKLWRKYRSKA
jgi:hypothetical protein